MINITADAPVSLVNRRACARACIIGAVSNTKLCASSSVRVDATDAAGAPGADAACDAGAPSACVAMVLRVRAPRHARSQMPLIKCTKKSNRRRECATRGTATATDGDGVDGVDGVDASSARGDGGVCGGGVRERGRRRWVLVARCGR